MKAWQIAGEWGFEHLGLHDIPTPAPAAGEVLLRMKAASLNYRDHLMVTHQYGRFSGELPLIPLSDGVGEVVALGEGVEDIATGQRLLPCFNQHWLEGELEPGMWGGLLGGPLDGTACQYMAVAAKSAAAVPDHLDDIEAATLGCAAITAWNALAELPGQPGPERSVVVQGTGGVSLFALQFAKVQGLRVIATSSSEEKQALLASLGADETLNYRSQPAWGKEVLSLTGGRGADLVVEVAGGENLKQSIRAVRDNGVIALIGNVGGSEATVNLPHIFMFRKRLVGISSGCVADFKAMMGFVAASKLKPVLDPKVHDFEDLGEAIRAMPAGQHVGKIAVRVS